MKKKLLALFTAAFTVVCAIGSGMMADAASARESTVTADMATASFWINNYGAAANNLLMSAAQIDAYNTRAIQSPGAHMYDIASYISYTDANAEAAELANKAINEAPNKSTLYIGGNAVDKARFAQDYANAISTTGFTGTIAPIYAVASRPVTMRTCPISQAMGYSASDSADESAITTLHVNEPVVVLQKCNVSGQNYYYVMSTTGRSWADANCFATFTDRASWLSTWQTSTTGKDFVVVTTSKAELDVSSYDPGTRAIALTMGTTLRLAATQDVAGKIAVVVPTRDANGAYCPQTGYISNPAQVSTGYLPMTAANIINVAFTCQGDKYCWGGASDGMDCSLFTKNVYSCFGLKSPRNTSWQQQVTGTAVGLSNMDSASKISYVASLAPGACLYINGHTMIYIGTVNGMNYVISAAGGIVDSSGTTNPAIQHQTVVTPLTIQTRSHNTWLNLLVTAVVPWNV